ncbi:hypothetical protein H0H92_015516 [Tricholoma furcatifolium]|nr:hypothetical protein H0H92_015516 [Tricholoma furcatifolium]
MTTSDPPNEPPPPYTPPERATRTSRVVVRTPPDLHQYPSDSEEDNDAVVLVPQVGRNGRKYIVCPGPHPSSLVRPNPSGNLFYVVTKGQKVGIFFSWAIVQDLTEHVPGASHQRCKTWELALMRYSDAYEKGIVEARILVGSQYHSEEVARRLNDNITRIFARLCLS